VGNGLDIGPNGYGPRFRPGLNYPTIYDPDEDDAEVEPPALDRVILGTTDLLLWAIAVGFGAAAIHTLRRGDPGAEIVCAMFAAGMLWGLMPKDNWPWVRRVVGWVATILLAVVVVACLACVWFVVTGEWRVS
jgi:hypothetical protein